MATVFFADAHLGNHRRFGGEMRGGLNDRARHCVAVLERCVEVAQKFPAHYHIIGLGDLFDTDRPNPQLLAAARNALLLNALGHDATTKRSETRLLVGNHDQHSLEDGDHALDVLAESYIGSRNIRVYERPSHVGRDGMHFILIPFAPKKAADHIAAGLKEVLPHGPADKGPTVLCIHAGIRDADTPWFLREAEDAVDVEELAALAKEFGVTHVFAGNWHNHKRWTYQHVEIVQVGSLIPTGFDDATPFHGCAVLHDNRTIEMIDLPGPRFVRASTVEELESYAASLVKGCTLYVDWRGSAEDHAALEAIRRLDATTDSGLAVASIERTLGSDGARAAVAAVGGVSLEEAVVTYVGGLALDEDMAAEVVKLAKGYLRC